MIDGDTPEFQSSPGLVTGRYGSLLGVQFAKDGVSILARSGDRALLDITHLATLCKLFQSSPGLVTGRYSQAVDHEDDVTPVSILARSGDRALPPAWPVSTAAQ